LLLIGAALAAATAGARPTYAPKNCRVPKVKPARIVLSCGDFGAFMTIDHWSRWGHRRANGTGRFHLNDCKPSCGEGHFHVYRVRARLMHPGNTHCGGRVVRMFKRSKLRFPGEGPPRAHFWRRSKLFCD
jgi:hypothetical protein